MSLAGGLGQGLDALGLSARVGEEQRAGLLRYLQLLEKWNRTYNLTAIREPERMLRHHLLDSLAILPHVGVGALLDVGSGAGLPGLPVAMARPDLQVTLLDAVEKKCAFLRQACIELGLSGVRVVHARVEEWHADAPFDQVVSRAFSDLNEMVRLTRHLLAPGGRWLAMKGALPGPELEALQGARLQAALPLDVPGVSAERHLIILEAA